MNMTSHGQPFQYAGSHRRGEQYASSSKEAPAAAGRSSSGFTPRAAGTVGEEQNMAPPFAVVDEPMAATVTGRPPSSFKQACHVRALGVAEGVQSVGRLDVGNGHRRTRGGKHLEHAACCGNVQAGGGCWRIGTWEK